jgi:hypothetical protein
MHSGKGPVHRDVAGFEASPVDCKLIHRLADMSLWVRAIARP